jgi:uncharacterized membrane protein
VNTLRAAAIITAAITSGLTAGLLFGWACSVMPGLARTDDRTFLGAFQAMDRAIMNPWFFVVFVGAVVLPGLAAVLHLGSDHRPVLLWTLAALALSLATVAITRVVHLPLNAAVQAAGDPAQITDITAVRTRFEARWVRWHLVRTVTSTAAFACLILATRS